MSSIPGLFLIPFPALAMVVALLFVPRYIRARAMMTLANRWNLSYQGSKLPGSFPLDRRRFPIPLNSFHKVFHVISGTCRGKQVLILEVLAGSGRSAYDTTILAVRADQNPFGPLDKPWKVIESNGWYALIRVGFWRMYWSISISQIETFLGRL